MPAAMAFWTTGVSAAGLGRVTAMPLTLLSMAFWMNVVCWGISIELEYLRSTLSFAAASSAPFWIWAQNASPGGAWVTMAMVRRGMSPPPGAAFFCAPPWLLHAAVAASIPATSPMRTRRLREPNIDVPSCGAGSFPADVSGRESTTAGRVPPSSRISR
jgi:hypothetical protein